MKRNETNPHSAVFCIRGSLSGLCDSTDASADKSYLRFNRHSTHTQGACVRLDEEYIHLSRCYSQGHRLNCRARVFNQDAYPDLCVLFLILTVVVVVVAAVIIIVALDTTLLP